MSLIVEEGELRVLLGANGAGKTTLMDLVSGKTKSTEGKVYPATTPTSPTRRSTASRAPALAASSKFQACSAN